MKIKYQLEIKDSHGNLSTSKNIISYLEFVKTISFAGITSNSNPLQNLFRFLENIYGFAPSFIDGKFHIHPELENDPTEKGQFSNKVGRTFAVYLAKKISGAKYVYIYECALKNKGYSISGTRPDYYCDTTTQFFSLEAKGRGDSSISETDMQSYKHQSQSGSLPKSFSIASATFNIYDSPKIKFYDPESDKKEYEYRFSEALRKDYYKGVLKILNSSFFNQSENIKEDFYSYKPIIDPDIFEVLVHKSIVEKKDLLEKIDAVCEGNRFIDTDGIGLIINMSKIIKRIKIKNMI